MAEVSLGIQFLDEICVERKKRQKRCILMGFCIPALTMLIAYIINGVYPFGDNGVTIVDSLHQYLPFFTDFQQKLTNGESLLYSFGGGLGYNMWAAIAYYLASPMNLLLALVPMEHVIDFMSYLILLKISLSGAIFAWYLTERNNGADYTPVPFACMYALSTFVIGYYFNLMWLDSIMVLPIIMKGIERILQGKSGKMFTLSLFYGIWCNYYIGYMICIFSCLYFIVQAIGMGKMTVSKFIKSGLKFSWSALLGGGMAAVLLVPAYLALQLTESAGSSFPADIQFYTDGITQLTGHFAFVEPITIYDDQSGVNLYCGVIVLILFFLYILDKKIRLAERISKTVLLLFLLFSMNFNMLNYIWHGFHTQNGLPNRFAFLYIWLLLVMGFDALRDIREYHPVKIVASWAVPTAFVAYCYWKNVGDRAWYVYVLTLVFLSLYAIMLLILRGQMGKRTIWKRILAIAISLEMVCTGIYGVNKNGTVGRSTYIDEQTAYQDMTSRQEDADEFYRCEIDSQHMRNENMFMGGNGLILFSSTMPAATVDMCGAIGMEARTNKTGYLGVTKLFNDVFGIRYVLARNNSETLFQMEKVDSEETSDTFSLYKNEDALSIGFMVSSDIKDWDINGKTAMEVQGDFAALATGTDFSYTLREAYSLEEGPTYVINLRPGEQTYIEFTEDVASLTIKTPQSEKTYNNFTTNLFNLGSVTEETKATITLTYKDGSEEPVPVRVYICTYDEYQEVYDKLSAHQLENVEVTGDTVSGTVHVDEEGTLLLTIPYDEGWTVTVDGETVDTYRIGEALTGIDLDTGDHEISMIFVPEGFSLGLMLSVLCIFLFVLTCIAEKQLQKWRHMREMLKAEQMPVNQLGN